MGYSTKILNGNLKIKLDFVFIAQNEKKCPSNPYK